MRVLIPIMIIVFILASLDLYVYKGIRIMTKDILDSKRIWIYRFYWFTSIIVLVGVVISFILASKSLIQSSLPYYWVFTIVLALFIPKALFAMFHLIEDISFLLYNQFGKTFHGGTEISRTKFLSYIGTGLAAIVLSSNLFGIFFGKYRYTVRRETISFPNLPKAFDGFKIVQFSDLHIGSFFQNFDPIKKAIKMMNDLKPDVILFTGDMVNNLASELENWPPIISQLSAKYGKYSVLGNHDYGDYKEWKTVEDKKENFQRFLSFQKEMGFNLLNNQNAQIEIGDDKIDIVGVENWSRRWTQYGDLNKAMENANSNFKILLSHDPSHWNGEVSGNTDIDLTLSGHTHGMQYGVEFFGFKWSPVKYVYPQWAGLYNSGKQYLYVNRGLGFIGFMGRVGIKPEITEITLKCA